jgi:formate-dependent phosphoribosylglycinamide formyltransferase (GAR transformylase)
MRNVVFAAPFPLETTMRFARAVGRLPGVRMLGIAQEAPGGEDRSLFADVVTVADGLDAGQLLAAARVLESRYGQIHRLVGILEPLQVQLAEVRRAMGIEGTDPKTADLFRDKARMKDELRRHGLPCARHQLIRSWSDAEAFVAQVGFPLVLKPTAGMGCKSTWRINSLDELRGALTALHASPEHPALAEEFLRGREFSFETITVGGQVRFQSATRYFPTPLEVMETPWIQWVVVLPRNIDGPDYADARALGVKAVQALGLETGMTHMEWFRRDDGSIAIGEIAARPPGANIVRLNSFAHDADMYRAWARAVVDNAFDGPYERKYAVGCAFLRGGGRGRVVGVRGVDRANERVGRLVVESKLPHIGAPKSDSYEGDGYVIVRDPDTEVVKQAMTAIIETIQVDYA